MNNKYWSHRSDRYRSQKRQQILAGVIGVMNDNRYHYSSSSSSSISSCRLCLQYHLLSFVAPVSVACGSSVSFVVCGSSSISCCSWLVQYLSFMAPVSTNISCRSITCGSSICCCLWLQYHLCRLVLWIQYLSFMAPVSPVACGSSSICHSLLWLSFVAPVSVVSSSCGSSISCCS